MFKYLKTSQLLLVSNCLQCNVSRVAERGVKGMGLRSARLNFQLLFIYCEVVCK